MQYRRINFAVHSVLAQQTSGLCQAPLVPFRAGYNSDGSAMAAAITFTFIGAFLVASIVGVFLTEAHPRYLMYRERKRAMQRIMKVAAGIGRNEQI